MNRTQMMAAGFVAAVMLAFGIGVFTGVTERLHNVVSAASLFGFQSQNTEPQDVDFSKFWQVWKLLNDNFVQTHSSSSIPTDEQKMYGAIAGLTDSYDDPYTVFLPPPDAKQFNEDIKSSFGGVGMELGERNGSLTVVSPLKGSPAERAGVQSGDTILAIDGAPAEHLAVERAVKLIRGEVGTKVKLLLQREGALERIEVVITRETIQIPIINTYARSDGIFIIELYSFSENSVDLFRSALRKHFESGSTKMILDLRGNPGGYLDAAVEMASYFLPVGDMVVTEDFSGKGDNVQHRSSGYNVFVNKKLSMAILVNQGSASASEILAGALSQHGVAKLVGTRTFGKGSVQQLIELGGGAELKITVAQWLTPNGQSISDGGLKPDIAADRTQEEVTAGKDPQKDAAVAWLITQ